MKLLALDIDDTLVSTGKLPSDRLKRAVRLSENNGVTVVLATSVKRIPAEAATKVVTVFFDPVSRTARLLSSITISARRIFEFQAASVT